MKIHYTECEPGEKLAGHVESYWFASSDGDRNEMSEIQKCFSSGMIELIIHLNEGKTYGKYSGRWIEYPKLFLVGLSKKTTEWKMDGDTRILGIRFKPETFSQISCGQFKLNFDGFREANSFFPGNLTNLIKEVAESGTDSEKIKKTEAHLIQTMNKNTSVNKYLTDAVKFIRTYPERTCEELYNEVCIGKRQLQRSFNSMLGISPSSYFNLIRIYKANRLINDYKENVSELAYNLGYSDPSHFNKKFKSYFGTPPIKYFDNRSKSLVVVQ